MDIAEFAGRVQALDTGRVQAWGFETTTCPGCSTDYFHIYVGEYENRPHAAKCAVCKGKGSEAKNAETLAYQIINREIEVEADTLRTIAENLAPGYFRSELRSLAKHLAARK